MSNIQENSGNAASEEISAKELILKIQDWFRFVLSRWTILLLFTGIGIALGIVYHLRSVQTYTANCTFTLDEHNQKEGASSGLALLGLGLGGNSEGGLFQGKNLMWLYSSKQMLEQSLLTPVDSANKKKLFIDWFFEIDKAGRKVRKKSKVKFPANGDTHTFGREENSLLGFAVGTIQSKYLKVNETKNTDNFITVTIESTDEQFAKEFSDVLVKTVNDFYITSKTQKLRDEIAILQQKTDNYHAAMTGSMYQTAAAAEAVPYANPNLQTLQVPSQNKGIGARVNTELYIEMARTLESNKMMLAKETPLIQVIEEPLYPLATSKRPLYYVTIIGGILFLFLGIGYLTVRRIYKSIMAK